MRPLLSALLLCISCSAALDIGAPHCYPKDEEIIQIALSDEIRRFRPSMLVLSDSTACPRRRSVGDITRYISGSAARSLVERNVSVTTLPSLPEIEGVRFISVDERRSMFGDHNESVEKEWQAFYRFFPNSAGLLNVSLPGYSDDNREALIYIEWQAGSLAAEGVVIRLRCRHGTWQVQRRLSQWVS